MGLNQMNLDGGDSQIQMSSHPVGGIFDKDGMTQQYTSLTQRVKIQAERIGEHEIIPPGILKKYISYAKHTVFPQLSMEACETLKDFYISLRENACNNTNTLPITSRCLDSLIRLS